MFTGRNHLVRRVGVLCRLPLELRAVENCSPGEDEFCQIAKAVCEQQLVFRHGVLYYEALKIVMIPILSESESYSR